MASSPPAHPLPVPIMIPRSRPSFPSRPPSAALSTTPSPYPSALPTPSTSAPPPQNALHLHLTPPAITPPAPREQRQPRVHFRPRVHISGAGGRYRFLPTTTTATPTPTSSNAQSPYGFDGTGAPSGATSVSSSFSVPLRPEPRVGEGKAAGGWFRRPFLSGGRGERAPLLGDARGVVDSPTSPTDEPDGGYAASAYTVSSPSAHAHASANGRPRLALARRVVPLAGDRAPPTGANGVYEGPSARARAREWEEETWEGSEEFAECPVWCAPVFATCAGWGACWSGACGGRGREEEEEGGSERARARARAQEQEGFDSP
ncbi:hypothetical protein CALCODRAFT_235641 [Calocera cornea HHB12733]|uniref:Uncharacterized protein n=1 Tax=Calocera cornea HHB12733 TaxID=1353952 RepID=A0A165GUN9_9BASI|nr:hypothetical protein CALCODRAFT_235641 [Calocera cornea HHB12733]